MLHGADPDIFTPLFNIARWIIFYQIIHGSHVKFGPDLKSEFKCGL